MKRTTAPAAPVQRRLRCAICTRKSSEEGRDMEFNSLDAQRKACESFIARRPRAEWRCATVSTTAASPAAP